MKPAGQTPDLSVVNARVRRLLRHGEFQQAKALVEKQVAARELGVELSLAYCVCLSRCGEEKRAIELYRELRLRLERFEFSQVQREVLSRVYASLENLLPGELRGGISASSLWK